MDITVHASDKRRAAGHRSRRVTARVALGAVRSVPGREAQDEPRPRLLPPAADRLGGNRALLGVMRKLLKRSYHTLRELGDEAFAPA